MSTTPDNSGWIGVDLDGTLAHYDGWKGANHIGAPIPAMVERVKAWLAQGRTVKIFTARMHGHGMPLIGKGREGQTTEDALTPIQAWCREHIGCELPVTNVKDFGMVELWDDRAVQVIPNTGKRADEPTDATFKIIRQISDILDAHGARMEIGAVVNSWHDTLEEDDVLGLLETFNPRHGK